MIYEQIQNQYELEWPLFKLTTQLPSKFNLPKVHVPEWGTTLDDSKAKVEWMVVYWSWMLEDIKRQYLTTEREALTMKEGLIKFQPFIK